MTDSIMVIAEIGVNHNGSLEIAKELIDAAVDCGADVAKFQSFKAAELVSKGTPLAKYQINSVKGKFENQLEMLKSLELDETSFFKIKNYCKKRKIEFLSTGFSISDLEFLNRLGLQRIKIPSGELNNYPYLKNIARYEWPVIISTGMAYLKEVEDAASVLVKNGLAKDKITILHCSSEYPVKYENANLLAISTIKKELNYKVGYSDHSIGFECSVAAVALGATTIEKHITLNKKMDGPDHAASTEPIDFKKFVTAIRNTKKALGDGVKNPSEIEIENSKLVRKSISAKIEIKIGELFSEDNLATIRPGTGINPMRWEEFLGRRATKQYQAGETIVE